MKVFLSALCLAALVAPAAARPELEKVVLLERHGVRAPTKEPDAGSARQAWPVWPVGPGELTDHGAAGVTRMGEALRLHYAALLPLGACAFIWGDAADQRTRESAKALARGLGSACAAQTAPGDSDPLFHPVEAGICPVDTDAAQAALTPRLAALLAGHARTYDKARASLQSMLGVTMNGENRVKDGKIEGGLAAASTLSEDLFLEYADGMDAPGWGRAGTGSAIAAIMPLHNFYTDLARRTPYLARRGASLLAHQIAAALAGGTARFEGAAPVPADARFVALVGHDTNLSNLAGALGLDWTLPGQPDATAPDSVMAFELWRDGGKKFVRVTLFYQTLDQLRHLTPFDAAHPVPRLPMPFAGCGARGCGLGDMTARLNAIAPDCIKP